MSFTIDPNSRKKSPATKGSVIGASGGKKVVDMTGENALEVRARERAGMADDKRTDKDMVAKMADSVTRATGKKLYSGDPALEEVLDTLMTHLTGERVYSNQIGDLKSYENGARYGFLGLLARRLPRPILLDHEDVVNELFPPNNKTFGVDPSGRMWIYADFMKHCLELDRSEGYMTLPVLNHEHLHIALEHPMRMHGFEPTISNRAKDAVINPMCKALYPEGTRFAKEFLNAWGNREEDKRFSGCSEETIAKIMQSEAIENAKKKGTIKIKLLEIVDGPVTQKIKHAPKDGETLELDHVVVTVEEIFRGKESVGDKLDTEFDCSICEIDQTINRLKPRYRKGGNGKQDQQDSIVDIPVISDGQGDDNDQDGQKQQNGKDGKSQKDGKDGQGDKNNQDEQPGQLGPRKVRPQQGSDGDDGNPFNSSAGHELNLEKIKQVLAKHGLDDVIDAIKPDSHSDDVMQAIIEQALSEAELEQRRVGPNYPGGHINEYMRDVVKPSLKHNVSWQQRTREFLQGEGPLISRSFDEQSTLALLDPADMGMDEDELPILPGIIPTRREGHIAVLIDSSGSMDGGRLVEAVSLVCGVRRSAGEMTPDIDVYAADTVIRGEPVNLTDEALSDIMHNGMAIGGRGGTEITGPLNQLMAYAREKNIKYVGVLYITDFGFTAPPVEALPPDLPPLMFLGIPADYKASESVVRALRQYSEVLSIDKQMTFDMDAAEEKAKVRGVGLSM